MFSLHTGQGHCFVMSMLVTVLELLYFRFPRSLMVLGNFRPILIVHAWISFVAYEQLIDIWNKSD